MKSPNPRDARTFGDWAWIAIAKHSHKMLKHEAEVLNDQDPEELHQMRVGMRRLRSAITGFAAALDLPRSATEKKVGKIAKILGKLRDLDVLGESLETHYKPALPKKEQKELVPAFKTLKKCRNEELEKVRTTLEGKSYEALKQGLNDWLEKPQYRDVSRIPIETVLPDLLLPQASQFLLHPGWFVSGAMTGEAMQVLPQDNAKTVERILEDHAEILHDLRKEAKRSRYQMELFAPFYGETYAHYVQEIKEIQEILGEIQDSFVLAEFLDETLDKSLEKSMPTLAEQLRQNRYQKWETWQTVQNAFRDRQTRNDLRLTLQNPKAELAVVGRDS